MRSYNIVAHADSGPCSWMQAFQIQISRCCSRSTKNVWKLSILTLMCLQLQITKFLGSIEHRGNYFAMKFTETCLACLCQLNAKYLPLIEHGL